MLIYFSLVAFGCDAEVEDATATALFFEDATGTAKPHQTQTAAAWTPTPRPTATTAPTATTDPADMYDTDDPSTDCVDSNDQPLRCSGNDILRVRFQSERPSIPAPPGEAPASFFPLTWVLIELDTSSGPPDPAFLVCLNLDLDADITTGIQNPAIRGTEQVYCHAPGMADIFITQYGTSGDYLQDFFLPADGLVWMTDGVYVMGVAALFSEDPIEIAEFVPVVISVCSDSPLSCDLIRDIEFATSENFEPTLLN